MTAVKAATRTNLSAGKKPAAEPMPEAKPEDAVVEESNTETVSASDFAKPTLADQSSAALEEDHDDSHDMTGNAPSPPHRLASSTALAATAGGALAATPVVPAEKDGHDDLDGEIGFGSFPILKLQNGSFVIDDVELGTWVEGILLSSRKKWIIKEKAQDTEYLVYTYDQIHVAGSEELLSERFAKWEEEGVDINNLEKKRYQEVVKIITGSEKNYEQFEKELVLCSVPPASVKRLAGHRAKTMTVYGRKLCDVITRAFKGRQLQGQNKKVFNPWDFKVVRAAKKADRAAIDLGDIEVGEED